MSDKKIKVEDAKTYEPALKYPYPSTELFNRDRKGYLAAMKARIEKQLSDEAENKELIRLTLERKE